MTLYISWGVLLYLTLGLLWFVNDRGAHEALATHGTTLFTRVFSTIAFIVTWPYWVYLKIRTIHMRYMALRAIWKPAWGDMKKRVDNEWSEVKKQVDEEMRNR